VEFGYKAQVLDNNDGIILDYSLQPGAAPDAPQLAPAVERIGRRTGHAPRAVTADRGNGDAGVETGLHEPGVSRSRPAWVAGRRKEVPGSHSAQVPCGLGNEVRVNRARGGPRRRRRQIRRP
jgi:hypothetical protein